MARNLLKHSIGDVLVAGASGACAMMLLMAGLCSDIAYAVILLTQ